jgi:hypothetical protein
MCNTIILISDIAGMLPGVGIPVDIAGVIISISCGDYFGAGLGLVSVIPVIGWLTGGIEIVRSILRLTSDSENNSENDSPFASGLFGDDNSKKGKNKKNNDRTHNSYEYEFKDDKYYEYEYYDDNLYKYEYYEK